MSDAPIDYSSQSRCVEVADSDEISFVFITGKRKNSKMLYSVGEQQLYYKKNVLKNYTVFVCCEKTCGAQLELLPIGKCRKSKKFNGHNHGGKSEEFQLLKMRERLVEDATNITNLASGSNSMKDLHDIYRDVLSK